MKKLSQAAFQRAMAFVLEQGRDLDRAPALHIILKVVSDVSVWLRWRRFRTTTAVSATVWNPISGLRHRQSLRRPWRSKTSGLFASQQTIQWCVGELNIYSKRTMCPGRCGRLFRQRSRMRPTRLGGTMPGAKRDLAVSWSTRVLRLSATCTTTAELCHQRCWIH